MKKKVRNCLIIASLLITVGSIIVISGHYLIEDTNHRLDEAIAKASVAGHNVSETGVETDAEETMQIIITELETERDSWIKFQAIGLIVLIIGLIVLISLAILCIYSSFSKKPA